MSGNQYINKVGYLSTLLSLILLLTITSCSNEIGDEMTSTDGTHTCRMYLQGSLGNYDGSGATRSEMSIADGTKLYLYFGSNTGTAVYHSTENEWTLTYNGSLSASGSCAAYYIPGGTESNGTITLTPLSAIYSTTEGKYVHATDGSITVEATLNPQLSRVRFKGTAGTNISVSGAKVAEKFYVSDHTITTYTKTMVIHMAVESNGYTPYIYYVQPDGSKLTISYGGKDYSIENPLKSTGGNSGYITIPNQHEYVDLGLPSGTLWATCNVGAASPEEYGDYFAWGETTPQSSNTYSWSSYKWCNGSENTLTKYCTSSSYGTVDNKTELEPADDAATANWGSDWCMPTHAQQQELVNSSYTTTTWTTQNGISGRLITSKTNGKSIFLPAAGFRGSGSLCNVGSIGYYWSSELFSYYSYDAWLLRFFSSNVGANYGTNRDCGQSVRAVRCSASE